MNILKLYQRNRETGEYELTLGCRWVSTGYGVAVNYYEDIGIVESLSDTDNYIEDAPRSLSAIRNYLNNSNADGIVYFKEGYTLCIVTKEDIEIGSPSTSEPVQSNNEEQAEVLEAAEQSNSLADLEGDK